MDDLREIPLEECEVEIEVWQQITPGTLCRRYGIGANGNLLAIADSGNDRVVL